MADIFIGLSSMSVRLLYKFPLIFASLQSISLMRDVMLAHSLHPESLGVIMVSLLVLVDAGVLEPSQLAPAAP
jgi:hypothetical protein